MPWTVERRALLAESRAARLAGRRFGRLVAVERLGSVPGVGFLWRCECDCGGVKVSPAAQLGAGNVRSCGCLSRKRPYEHLYNHLKYLAGARGLVCPLTYEEFLPFTREEGCHYCGNPLDWATYTRVDHRRRTNLDRKNNEVGYGPGNVVACCWQCNDGKGNRYTYGEWKAMTAALRAYRGTHSGA